MTCDLHVVRLTKESFLISFKSESSALNVGERHDIVY